MSAALPLSAQDEQLRADCYRVLARLFAAPPDSALLDALAHAAPGAEDAIGKAWNQLRAEATKVGPGSTAQYAALQRMQDDYTELFFGVGEPRVMLYASWYRSGSLMDAPLAQLRDDLARLGFAREPQVREPEDHLAALLEVMALLVADGRGEQQEFFRRHLAGWFAPLCQRLEAESSEFYRAVARFAQGVLAAESELLAD